MIKFLIAIMLTLFMAVGVSAKTIKLTSQNSMTLNGQVDGGSMNSLMVKLQE